MAAPVAVGGVLAYVHAKHILRDIHLHFPPNLPPQLNSTINASLQHHILSLATVEDVVAVYNSIHRKQRRWTSIDDKTLIEWLEERLYALLRSFPAERVAELLPLMDPAHPFENTTREQMFENSNGVAVFFLLHSMRKSGPRREFNRLRAELKASRNPANPEARRRRVRMLRRRIELRRELRVPISPPLHTKLIRELERMHEFSRDVNDVALCAAKVHAATHKLLHNTRLVAGGDPEAWAALVRSDALPLEPSQKERVLATLSSSSFLAE